MINSKERIKKRNEAIEFHNILSQNLINLMTTHKATRTEIAAICGVTANTISRWIASDETALPEIYQVIKLCDYYHIDINKLVRNTGEYYHSD